MKNFKKIIILIGKLLLFVVIMTMVFIRGAIEMMYYIVPKMAQLEEITIGTDEINLICDGKNPCECIKKLSSGLQHKRFNQSNDNSFIRTSFGRHESYLLWGLQNDTFKLKQVFDELYYDDYYLRYTEKDLVTCKEKLANMTQLYVNNAMFYGVGIENYNDASHYYFDKDPNQLGLCQKDILLHIQSNVLTGNLQSGYLMDPMYVDMIKKKYSNCD